MGGEEFEPAWDSELKRGALGWQVVMCSQAAEPPKAHQSYVMIERVGKERGGKKGAIYRSMPYNFDVCKDPNSAGFKPYSFIPLTSHLGELIYCSIQMPENLLLKC
jgi:hypothetical protein